MEALLERGLKALADAIATPELTCIQLVVRSPDVVRVKGIIEAHDGLAQVYAAHGGELTLVACADRRDELEALAGSLAAEFAGVCIAI
jgi:hypothetical protein